MNNQNKIFFILSFFLSFSITAQKNTDVLTIEDAINYAFKNNPSILKIENSIEIKRGEKWKSLGLDSPEIGYMKEGIKSGQSGFIEKQYSISQSMDFPLTSIFNFTANSNEVSALELDYQSKKRELKVDVKSAYVVVLASISIKELREQQLELSKDLYNAVYSRVEAGVSSELEVLKASLKLDESKNDLNEASNEYHRARYNLFNKVGIDPENQNYTISFDDTLRFIELDLDQENILELIPLQPEVLSLEAKLNAKDNIVNASWSSLLPKLNFSYYIQDIGDGFDYHGYELGLSVPVWFMINEGQDIRIANAEANSVEWEKRKLILNLKKDIELSWHSYETSREKIDRYKENIRKRAKELLDLTLEGYKLGDIDLLNLLYAQETFLSSELRYLETLKNYYIKVIEIEKYLDRVLVF